MAGGGAGRPGGLAGLLPVIMGALQNKTSGAPGQDLSQQSANLQGSDPGMVAKGLDEINKALGVLFVRTFQTQPNVANKISATMKSLSAAIKEAGEGAAVSQVVAQPDSSQNPPIDFSAARSGGQPDLGAAA
jgi:hypothetical protein